MTNKNAPYNYPHMKLSYYNNPVFVGPKVGEQAIDFTATTLDGKEVKLSDYFGKTIVLETGSISCPVYIQNLPTMNELAVKYPDIQFLLLYIREAHPGSKIHEHQSFKEKMQNAKHLTEVEPERRTILVDDLAGTAHQAYGAGADMIYIFDNTGKVLYRNSWADAGRVGKAIELIHQGNTNLDSINNMERTNKAIKRLPIGIRVFKRTGWNAAWDLFSQALSILLKPDLRKGTPK